MAASSSACFPVKNITRDLSSVLFSPFCFLLEKKRDAPEHLFLINLL